MKNARDLNIFIERGLRIGIIASIGSFVGAGVSIMLAASFTTEHFENPRTMVVELLGSVLGSKTVWLLILSIILAIVYQVLYRPLDHVRINFRNITNGLVYLYALTPFLYIFRPGFLAIAVVCVGLMASLTGGWERPRESMGRFKGVVLILSALFLIGIGRAWTGIDELRSRIPIGLQINLMLAYVHAMVVYYVVRRNQWGSKQFETFFKLIILLGMIVSLESLITFYIGVGQDLTVFGRVPLVEGKLFNSMWIGTYDITARIALSMVFVSLYFYTRYSKPIYITSALPRNKLPSREHTLTSS